MSAERVPPALPKTLFAKLWDAHRIATLDEATDLIAIRGPIWANGTRAMLREGLDMIDLTLRHRDAIVAFREADRTRRPWAYAE